MKTKEELETSLEFQYKNHIEKLEQWPYGPVAQARALGHLEATLYFLGVFDNGGGIFSKNEVEEPCYFFLFKLKRTKKRPEKYSEFIIRKTEEYLNETRNFKIKR